VTKTTDAQFFPEEDRFIQDSIIATLNLEYSQEKAFARAIPQAMSAQLYWQRRGAGCNPGRTSMSMIRPLRGNHIIILIQTFSRETFFSAHTQLHVIDFY
jgi:hypothetical protein